MLGGFWRLLCAIQRPNGDTGFFVLEVCCIAPMSLKGAAWKSVESI